MTTAGSRGVVWVVLLLLLGGAGREKRAVGAESPYERAKALYPEQIPPFVRAGFRKYDEGGEHFSVGYNRFFLLTTTVCAFTAYFYPCDQDLRGHLAACREEVLKAHPAAEVGQTDKVTAEKNGRRHAGLRVRFKYEDSFGGLGKRQKLVSELWVFRDGARAVKYRVTYPEADEKTERKHLETLLKGFPWPK